MNSALKMFVTAFGLLFAMISGGQALTNLLGITRGESITKDVFWLVIAVVVFVFSIIFFLYKSPSEKEKLSSRKENFELTLEEKKQLRTYNPELMKSINIARLVAVLAFMAMQYIPPRADEVEMQFIVWVAFIAIFLVVWVLYKLLINRIAQQRGVDLYVPVTKVLNPKLKKLRHNSLLISIVFVLVVLLLARPAVEASELMVGLIPLVTIAAVWLLRWAYIRRVAVRRGMSLYISASEQDIKAVSLAKKNLKKFITMIIVLVGLFVVLRLVGDILDLPS